MLADCGSCFAAEQVCVGVIAWAKYLETRKTPESIIISQLDGIWQRASDFVRMQIVISVDSPAGLQCVCRQL